MKKLLFPFVFLLAAVTSYAQADTIQPPKKSYVVKVTTTNSRIIKGMLSSANDSQLVLINSIKAVHVPVSANNMLQVPAENIQSFTMKRKNSGLRGALIGFGIGAFTGIVAGFVSGDDDPDTWFAMTAGEKAVGGGILLGGTGAIIGAIIGGVAKKTFIIGGKKEKFRDLQAELMMKLVKK
ncbi:MAG TPA: hypothetical protein VIZ28_16820 [Chitinophagaceae bacterium]